MNITANKTRDIYGSLAQLAEVTDALRCLHKTLLEAHRVSFEKLYGRIDGAGAFLQIVIPDPLFAWLRPLSALIAELDDLAGDDGSVVDRALLSSVRGTIE